MLNWIFNEERRPHVTGKILKSLCNWSFHFMFLISILDCSQRYNWVNYTKRNKWVLGFCYSKAFLQIKVDIFSLECRAVPMYRQTPWNKHSSWKITSPKEYSRALTRCSVNTRVCRCHLNIDWSWSKLYANDSDAISCSYTFRLAYILHRSFVAIIQHDPTNNPASWSTVE